MLAALVEDLNDKLYNFYQTFIADNEISEFQKKVVEKVLEVKPQTVIDFGCNTGNVMQYLKSQTECAIDIKGFDFGKMAVKEALKKGLDVYWADDKMMYLMVDNNSVDVVYACSVLSHIVDDSIIVNLIDIAKKRVVLAETQERKGEFYFPHDYQKYGFKLVDVVKNKYQVEYEIWVLDK